VLGKKKRMGRKKRFFFKLKKGKGSESKKAEPHGEKKNSQMWPGYCQRKAMFVECRGN